MSFSSSLDLQRLLFAQASLATLVGISAAPTYNLPLALFGLVCTSSSVAQSEADLLRFFAGLQALSVLLDVIWWTGSAEVSGLTTFLLLINLALKPVVLLAATANLRQRGEATLPSFGGNGGSWNIPGGFSSSSHHANNQGYSGFGDADAEEYEEPLPVPPKAKPAQPTPPAPPKGPAQGGGYHSIGDED